MAHNKEMNLAWQFIEGTRTSVFLTGKAGTGKTTFLRKIRELSPKRMVVLAPTGVAAINACGQTIHSFFQLSLLPFYAGAQNGKDSKYFRMSKEKKNLLRTMDLLVIDEISMVRCDTLDAVDDVLRRYRNPNEPFGGVQLLLIGDLQQLAPVAKENEWEILSRYYATPYFFSSHALQQVKYVTIELQMIYRQQDRKFIDILAGIRNNNLSDVALEELNSRYIPNFSPETTTTVENKHRETWIRLTTHNRQANSYNETRLGQLPDRAYSFQAEVEGTFPEMSYPTDKLLTLKKGAQVMFVKNDTQPTRRYYNGKIGTIANLSAEGITVCCVNDDTGDQENILVTQETWSNMRYAIDEKTKEIKEEVEGTFRQYPLRLAWAITVHKSQGLTFKHAILDINNSFAHGQVYVALSRCRTLEGLVLTAPLYRGSIINDGEVDKYVTESIEENKDCSSILPQCRYDYFYSLLTELFSFGKVYYDFEHLMRVAGNNFSNSQATFLDMLRNTRPRVNDELIVVANKFKLQYDRMLQEAGTEYQNDERLQERLKTAAAYFHGKTEELFEHLISAAKTVCKALNNKAIQKQMKIAVEALELSYYIKKGTLNAVELQGFSTKIYTTAKAMASIIDEKKSKPTRQKKK